jgi:dihydropteroate synthase
MGVLNVTPDSFSDGGRYLDPDAAVARGLDLVAEGADLLDVGGESTRPGADPVPPDEERDRVVPVIERLAAATDVPISIDTRRAAVTRAALAAGARILNDVSGLRDPAMAGVAAESGAPLILMHMRGTPADMRERAVYEDVVGDVAAELLASVGRARAAGVRLDRIVLDPGIGFAKTAEQSLTLLRRLPDLVRLGYPVLVGPSRKSFLASIRDVPPAERLSLTLGAVCACAAGGARIVRVHDVRPAADALRAFTAATGSPRSW